MSKKIHTKHIAQDPLLKVNLPNDFGEDLSLTGHLLGEEMYFDDNSGMLTMEKLYREDDTLAYSIVSAIGHSRERRAYKIEMGNESVKATNGSLSLEFSHDELIELLAVAIEAEKETATDQVSEQIRRRLASNE